MTATSEQIGEGEATEPPLWCDTLLALEVRTIPHKGRGVFARRSFQPSDLIEIAPVIVVPEEEYPSVERSIFYHYLFTWGTTGKDTALVLGYGSLYNHSYEPNARYFKHFETSRMQFVAIRPIEPGEEITINYNCDPLDCSPLWFEVVE